MGKSSSVQGLLRIFPRTFIVSLFPILVAACQFFQQPVRSNTLNRGTFAPIVSPSSSPSVVPSVVPSPIFSQVPSLPSVTLDQTFYSGAATTASLTVGPCGSYTALLVQRYGLSAPSLDSGFWQACTSRVNLPLESGLPEGISNFSVWFKTPTQRSDFSQNFWLSIDRTPPSAPTNTGWRDVQELPGQVFKLRKLRVTARWTPSISSEPVQQVLRVHQGANCTGSPTSYTFSGSEHSFDGREGSSYSFRVAARDLVGNEAVTGCSIAPVIELDTTRPTVSISASATRISSGESVTFTAIFRDDIGIKSANIQTALVRREDGRAASGCVATRRLLSPASLSPGNDREQSFEVVVSGCTGPQRVALVIPSSDSVLDYADNAPAAETASALVEVLAPVTGITIVEGLPPSEAAPYKTVGYLFDLKADVTTASGPALAGNVALEVVQPDGSVITNGLAVTVLDANGQPQVVEQSRIIQPIDSSGRVTFSSISLRRYGRFKFRMTAGSFVGVSYEMEALWDFVRLTRVSGTAAATDGVRAIAMGPQGDVFSAGFFGSAITFPPLPQLSSAGGSDIFITRQSRSGTYLARGSLGTSGADSIQGLVVDASGAAYLLGSMGANPTVAKFLPSGSGQTSILRSWSQQVKTAGDGTLLLNDVVLADSSTLYVVGSFTGTVTLGGQVSLTSRGLTDILVAKLQLGASGFTVLWARKAGGSNGDSAASIALSPDGTIVIAGSHSGTVSYPSSFITYGGGYLQLGSQTSVKLNAVVAKLDRDGRFIWVAEGGGTANDDAATAVTVSSDGSVYWGGYLQSLDASPAQFQSSNLAPNGLVLTLASKGGKDGFVVKSTADGAIQWANRFGAPTTGDVNHDVVQRLAAGNSRVFVLGEFATRNFGAAYRAGPAGVMINQGSGTSDIFVSELDASDGKARWLLGGGSGGADVGRAIAVDGDSGIYVGGEVAASSPLNFGSISQPLSSSGDGYILRIGAP